MPDIYGNIAVNASPIVESGVNLTRPNLDTTISQPNQLGGVSGTGNPLLDLFNSSRISVTSQPWARSESYTEPTLKTPFKYAERYIGSGIPYDVTNPNLEQEASDYSQSGLWGTLKGIGNRLVKIGAGATVSILNSAKDIGDLFSPQSAVNDSFQTSTNKWLDRLDQVSLPNYQNQYQKDNPILSYFTPWHLPSFLDNVGKAGQALAPIAGTVATAALADVPLGLITDGIADNLLLPKQLSRIMEGLGDLSKGLSASDEDFTTFRTLLQSNQDLSQSVNGALKTARNFKYGANTTRFIVSNGLSAYTMSMMIGNDTYNQVKNDLSSKYRDEYGNVNAPADIQKNIEDTSLAAGKAVVIPNFAFMAVSSAMGLGAILKPSQAAIEATEKALAKEASVNINPLNPNIFDVTSKQYSKGFTGYLQKAFSKRGLLVDNLRQALTMGGFYVASDATKNFYEHQFDLGGVKDSMTLADYYMQSLGKLFTTSEGQEQLALGFLGGAMEHAGKTAVERVRGIETSPQKIASNTAEALNRYTVTGLFDVSRNEAISASTLAKQMQDAASTGDVFNYKNLQHKALFNFVLSGENVHQFEARINQLESLKTLNKENFETLFGIDFDNANKKTVSDYIDSVINKAKSIRDTIKKVNSAFFDNPFNPTSQKDDYSAYNYYKGELAYAISAQGDYLRRANDIKAKTLDKLPGAVFEDLKQFSYEDGLNQALVNFSKKITDLKNSEELSGNNEELRAPFRKQREFLEDKVADLKSNLKENNPDTYIQTLKDIYKYYGDGQMLGGDTNLDDIDVLDIFNNTHDFNQLGIYGREIADRYKKLTSKQGYENFRAEFQSDALNFVNSVDVTSQGLFKVKPIVSDIEQTDAYKASLGVDTVEAAIEKINAGDKEFIAKVIDPSHQATDDKESIGNKIVDGTQEITPEIKEQAIQLVKDDFQRQQEAKPSDEAARVKEQMKQMGVAAVVPGSSAAAVDEMYADQDAALEDAQTENEATQNIVTRLWKGLISPIKLLNKFYSSKRGGAESEDEVLRKAIFDTNPELVQRDVIGKLRAEISESTDDVTKAKYQLIPGSKGLYRVNNHKLYVRMYLGDKLVGFINDPDSIVFRRGDKYLPISQVADAAEYAEVTGNDAKTFTQFKRSVDEFNKSYNDLTKDYNGTVSLVDNKRLTSLFDPNVSFGGKDTSLKEADSTLIKDLKYKGKGSAILSFPIEFNGQTRRWERTTKPNILNEDKLSDDEISDVLDFVDKKIKSFHDLDRRYFYLTKLPDGKFSDSSIIVARPANETEAGLSSAYGIIRSAVEGKSSPEEANKTLRNSLYLSDKNTGKSKEKGNQIRMGVDKDGNLSITFYNTHRKISGAPVVISKEDILNTNNFDELSSLISSRVEQVKKSDYNLGQRMRPVIEKTSFKKAILDDEAISSDQAESLLKASVKPNVFKDYTIELMPKVPEIPTASPAPAEATPIVAATPVVVVNPVVQTQSISLPEDLKGAKPTYNYGQKHFNLQFDNDIDRAAYITAQTSRSKRDQDYLQFVMNSTGMTEADVRAHGELVRGQIKQMAKEGKGDETLTVPSIYKEAAEEIKNQPAISPKDQTINDNMDSIVSQLEQKGIAKKEC